MEDDFKPAKIYKIKWNCITKCITKFKFLLPQRLKPYWWRRWESVSRLLIYAKSNTIRLFIKLYWHHLRC
jgi:hypothetical protein